VRLVDGTLAAAVSSAVAHLELTPADDAAVRLTLHYAEALDAGGGVEKLGPALLRCLQQLGATPMARAEIGKRVLSGAEESALGRLRAAHRV
jgi:hypothetical protein